MSSLDLVHDVLDMQLVDRAGEKMGRVDGITLELRDGEPPRVAELLVGGTVLADRLGGWMVALAQLFAHVTGAKPVVTRVPFAVVQEISSTITLDAQGGATSALRTERWLDRIICRIPGSSDKSGKEQK
ncbi:MAG TPA: hypothetical protein VF761_12650 [Gemmatimonadaceae bacterium]